LQYDARFEKSNTLGTGFGPCPFFAVGSLSQNASERGENIIVAASGIEKEMPLLWWKISRDFAGL
jgi:hypothetical protein